MIIGLHTPDDTAFPSLPLMKISAWHKAEGDAIEWFEPGKAYDRLYSSKVFPFTPEDARLPPSAIRGGTGYGMRGELPWEIEHIKPDYGLYGLDYSVGFLTRGCNRDCDWCIVREKEGEIRPHADVEEFLAHRDAVFLDNNVLAHDFGIDQIAKIARLRVRADFNQGLDARLIDDGVARRLAKVTWRTPLRLACDFKGMIPAISRAVTMLRWHDAKPRRYFVYVLVRDIGDALERVRFLKGMHLDPFAQPYRPPCGGEPGEIQKHFARWCNHKAEFHTRTWEEYAAEKGLDWEGGANAIRTDGVTGGAP